MTDLEKVSRRLGLGFCVSLSQNIFEAYLREYYSKTFSGQENQSYILLGKGSRPLCILLMADGQTPHNHSSLREKDQSEENID